MSTFWICPWTRAESMTVTMPTMEELMVMGTAIISRLRMMVALESGVSLARPSRLRPMR